MRKIGDEKHLLFEYPELHDICDKRASLFWGLTLYRDTYGRGKI